MSKILLPLALVLGLFACKKNDCGMNPASDADQIIFGVGYAECLGDCSRNYRLTASELFPDNCDYCTLDHIPFQKTALSDDKFQIAKPLRESIAAEVLNTPDTVFGCPGCHDEGAYYLEITQNGTKHTFQWSSDFVDIPEELHPYFKKVMQTLMDL